MCYPNACVSHLFPTNLSQAVFPESCSKLLHTDCCRVKERPVSLPAQQLPLARSGAPLGFRLCLLPLRASGSLHKSWQGCHCMALTSGIGDSTSPSGDSTTVTWKQPRRRKLVPIHCCWLTPDESSSEACAQVKDH